MSNETTCVVQGVDMLVHFDYCGACGDGWNEPITPPEITINSVTYHDLDVMVLLGELDMESIEHQIEEARNCNMDY